MNNIKKILVILIAISLLAGCAGKTVTGPEEKISKAEKHSKEKTEREREEKKPEKLIIISPRESVEGEDADESGQNPEKDIKDDAPENKTDEENRSGDSREKELPENKTDEGDKSEKSRETKGSGKVVVLDPGHSAVLPGGKEPIGPGSSKYKSTCTSGTSGVASGMPEYKLVLIVSLQLKEELENRGYTVIMTRETNDVAISNSQRAKIANDAKADAFIRIHADGSSDQSAHGAMTISPTPNNPFIPELYEESRRLSDCVIEKLCKATGCRNRGVWETDSMSGINWSKVPVTIVEMGFMTNPEEDMLMQQPEYQEKIVDGIANGIDAFLSL